MAKNVLLIGMTGRHARENGPERGMEPGADSQDVTRGQSHFVSGDRPGEDPSRLLVQIKVSARLRHGLLARLLQRFLEALRERVAPRSLRLHRLLEQLIAAGFLVGQNPMGVVELRLAGSLGFLVPDDALEAGIDDERGVAAGTRHFVFSL